MNCRIILYGECAVFGPDVQRFLVDEAKSFLVSPNEINVIRVESLQYATSNAIDIKNPAGAAFSICVIINDDKVIRPLTTIRYNGRYLVIDKRWVISELWLKRRVARVPNQLPNHFLTIEMNIDNTRALRTARFDIQLNDGNFVAVFYNSTGILFARFNGNYVVNRYGLHINRCIDSMNRRRAEAAPLPNVEDAVPVGNQLEIDVEDQYVSEEEVDNPVPVVVDPTVAEEDKVDDGNEQNENIERIDMPVDEDLASTDSEDVLVIDETLVFMNN